MWDELHERGRGDCCMSGQEPFAPHGTQAEARHVSTRSSRLQDPACLCLPFFAQPVEQSNRSPSINQSGEPTPVDERHRRPDPDAERRLLTVYGLWAAWRHRGVREYPPVGCTEGSVRRACSWVLSAVLAGVDTLPRSLHVSTRKAPHRAAHSAASASEALKPFLLGLRSCPHAPLAAAGESPPREEVEGGRRLRTLTSLRQRRSSDLTWHLECRMCAMSRTNIPADDVRRRPDSRMHGLAFIPR